MNYILYSDVTKPTAIALAEFLNIRAVSQITDPRINKLIRWGSARVIRKKPRQVLNKRNAILQAVDKLGTLISLSDRGIRVPQFFSMDNHEGQNRFPYLARMINHTQGRDITLCLQQKDLERARERGYEYAVKYIPTKREYRIHVFKNEIIKVSEKVETEPENAVPYIRNLDHGYTFRHERTEISKESEWLAVEAVRALDLDFGAVDLVVSDEEISYVLEVNTAPSLIDSGIEKYGEKLAEWLEV